MRKVKEVLKRFFGYLQHPTEVLPQLIEAINGGCDLAIASRYTGRGGVSNWSLIRRAISRTAQLIGLVILPEVLGRVSDPASGYFLIRGDAIAGRRLDPLGHKILIEVISPGEHRQNLRDRLRLSRAPERPKWGFSQDLRSIPAASTAVVCCDPPRFSLLSGRSQRRGCRCVDPVPAQRSHDAGMGTDSQQDHRGGNSDGK